MLVETDGETDVELARLDRHLRAEQRGAARGAAIADIDKLNSGQTETVDHGIGVAGRIRTAVGELDLRPCDTRIGHRRPSGMNTLIHARNAIGTAKGMNTDADDAHIAHALSPTGA